MAKTKQGNKKIVRQKSPFTSNLSLTLALLAIFVIVTFVIVNLNFNSELNIDESIAQNEVSDESNYENLKLSVKPFATDDGDSFPLEQTFGASPIWGTLNSGQYFSLKLSSPKTMEFSLMWFANELNNQGRLNVRHLCDQNDQLKAYAWHRHDFYNFGQQTIQDGDYTIKTSFVINPANKFEWKARVDVEFNGDKRKLKPLSVIQYLTTDSSRDKLMLKASKGHLEENSQSNTLFQLGGHSKDIGDFQLSIIYESSGQNFVKGNFFMGNINKEKYPISLWLQTKLHYSEHGKNKVLLLPGSMKIRPHPFIKDDLNAEPNIIAYQLIVSGSASFSINLKQDNSDTFNEIDQDYGAIINDKSNQFDNNFLRLFPIDQFNFQEPHNNLSRREIDQTAKVSLSNMIGSIGYFYGHSYVGSESNKNEILPYGPIQLLTGVPSRSFFPRGFLWDDAFHNLIISQFDSNLSNLIIKSWFQIMNTNGWIPREIILGPESIRRVPREFIIQMITNANPPAMFLAIRSLLRRGKLEPETLRIIYPRLKAWYKWFNTTQSGPKPSTFRWRGRDEYSVNMLNPKTLTSGLDDYPRPSHPSPLEYHVDLRCWMAYSARTLAELALEMKDSEYFGKISREADELYDNEKLDKLHWSEENRMYCDFGYDTDKAELRQVTKTRLTADGYFEEQYQVFERHSTGHPKFGCVKEFGYVSLFPMLLNILDHKSDKLGILLDRIADEREIWTSYGLRSLSKSSKYYNKYNTEHDKPYWRGPIWMNLNYLILSSLNHYSKLDGPHRERCADLFIKLRQNLVRNVVNEFSRTNYTWEHYDDSTGRGKGSHPFTGWSSLILLIMSGTEPSYI